MVCKYYGGAAKVQYVGAALVLDSWNSGHLGKEFGSSGGAHLPSRNMV